MSINPDACKAVVYHYVRDSSNFMPNLKHLHVEDFRKQLEYFKDKFGFIKREEWEKYINNEISPPKGILLTFDDGLIDHYQFVLPVLNEMKLWGIFYICSDPLIYKKILNVHKIHYLLGRYEAREVFEIMKKVVISIGLKPDLDKLNTFNPYKSQLNDKYSLTVKKINYLPRIEDQNTILNALIEHFYHSDIWGNIYMDQTHIKEIEDAGNIIGGHSKSHNLLSVLTKNSQYDQVVKANDELNKILNFDINCFSYPYGGKDSYNEITKQILKENNIKYAFCVDPNDITPKLDKFELPRYDCNLFAYGKSRNVF